MTNTGPDLSSNLQTLPRTTTKCKKCLGEQQAYHQQLDTYDEAKRAYEAQLAEVRQKAEAFLDARTAYDRDYGAYEKLVKEADEILFGNSDRSIYTYNDVKADRDAAEPAARQAEAGLKKARRELDAALKKLEDLRSQALSEMRKAVSLELAMYRCELTCEVSELDLDEEPPKVSLPAGSSAGASQTPAIAASEVPKPENFIGIVAKCAACQALAEKVNTIRSHRRSFATSAEMLYQSLSANRASLERRKREAVVLAQKERELYQQLLSSFTAQAPDEGGDPLDQTFDKLDQQEAETALKGLSEQRAQNARDIAGLEQTIAQQTQGLLTAIANYRLHSLLLEAARKELADCEKTCKPAKDAKAALNPFVDPAYPQQENIDFILAKCPKCQVFADELMQVLSERRSIAGDIQTEVWLLKGRRKSLTKWEAQDDALQKEERVLTAFLIGDTGLQDEGKVLDRLFEIEELRTQLIQDMLWAEDEITRLEAQLKANLKKHATLSKRAGELRQALADCETTCRDAKDDGKKISLPQPIYDPAYPQPISFIGIVAKCAACQPEAEALNTLLSKRYVLAGDIQSTAARLKHNSALLAKREQELKALLAREQELIPAYTKFDDSPEQQAASKELDKVDFARRRAEADVAGLKKLNAQDQAGLDRMLREHAALETEIGKAQAALAACEAQKCKPAGQGGAIGLPGAGGQGAPASPFVSSDCQPCQTIVSMTNDAVGTLIGAARSLKAAKDKLAQLKQEAKTRADKLRAVLARESQLNEAWLTTQDEDKRAELDEELNKIDKQRNALTDARAKEAGEQKAAEAAIAAAQKQVDDLKALIAKLKADLAECEKQCKPAGQGGAIGLPGAGGQGAPASPFVSSDCQPCQTIVSMTNDVIGTRITVAKQVAKGAAALKALRAEIAAKEAAKAAAQEAFSQAIVQKADLAKAGEDVSALEDTIKEELNKASALLTEIEDLEIKELELAQALQEAKRQWQKLKKREKELRAQLDSCEQKRCNKPAKKTDISVSGQAGANDGLQVILDKLQKGKCKGGAVCDFEIILKNDSDSAFVGPVFVDESGALPGGTTRTFDDWSCSPTGKRGSICLHPKGPEAGGSLSLHVSILQPDAKGRLPQNCVELKVADDGRVLIQMIQAGLAAKGFDGGPADGLEGPKTRRALAAFNEANGQRADLKAPKAAFETLFGAPPMQTQPAGRTDTCIDINDDRDQPLIGKGVKIKIKLDVLLEELFKSGQVEEEQIEEELEEEYPDDEQNLQGGGWEKALFEQEFFKGGATPESAEKIVVDEVKKKIKKKIPLPSIIPKLF